MRRGDHDEAGRHLDRALNLFIEADQPRGRAHILLAQAELLRMGSDLPGARAKATEAAQLARTLGEMASVSEANQVLASIAAAEGNHQLADALFGESIEVLNELQLSERLTSVYAAYATVLENRGDVAGALKHWRLAVAATQLDAAPDITDRPASKGQFETA
jgi:tetratricopeptide (TPR) repeat protein